MQWPTVVPVLHNLELSMVHYPASSFDISDFFWCGRNPICQLMVELLTFFFAVLAILMLLGLTLPHIAIFSNSNGIVPWISLSVSLNIIVTSMICFRLLRMRALLRQVLAPEMCRTYTNIAAMVVESSAPFTILGIAGLVTAVRNSSVRVAFGYAWTLFNVCRVPSPLAYSHL